MVNVKASWFQGGIGLVINAVMGPPKKVAWNTWVFIGVTSYFSALMGPLLLTGFLGPNLCTSFLLNEASESDSTLKNWGVRKSPNLMDVLQKPPKKKNLSDLGTRDSWKTMEAFENFWSFWKFRKLLSFLIHSWKPYQTSQKKEVTTWKILENIPTWDRSKRDPIMEGNLTYGKMWTESPPAVLSYDGLPGRAPLGILLGHQKRLWDVEMCCVASCVVFPKNMSSWKQGQYWLKSGLSNGSEYYKCSNIHTYKCLNTVRHRSKQNHDQFAEKGVTLHVQKKNVPNFRN